MIAIHDKEVRFSSYWISYGYSKKVYQPCPGYWDRDLHWIEGSFNPQEWMVDTVLKQIRKKQKHADLL